MNLLADNIIDPAVSNLMVNQLSQAKTDMLSMFVQVLPFALAIVIAPLVVVWLINFLKSLAHK